MEKRGLKADQETKGNECQSSFQNGNGHVSSHRGRTKLLQNGKPCGKPVSGLPTNLNWGDWNKCQSGGSGREKAVLRCSVSSDGGLSHVARGVSVVMSWLSKAATKAVTVKQRALGGRQNAPSREQGSCSWRAEPSRKPAKLQARSPKYKGEKERELCGYVSLKGAGRLARNKNDRDKLPQPMRCAETWHRREYSSWSV